MRPQEILFVGVPFLCVGVVLTWSTGNTRPAGSSASVPANTVTEPLAIEEDSPTEFVGPTRPVDVAEPSMMSAATRQLVEYQRDGSRQNETATSLEYLGPQFHVDQLWRSMEGPSEVEPVYLGHEDESELVWITGCHVEMVGPDGTSPKPADYMCHVNVDIDVERHYELFSQEKSLDGRLFTLSQGQLSVEFPPGFGIPVRSDEAVEVATQVLNLNRPDASEDVRHRVRFTYARDVDTDGSMVPLYESGIFAMKALDSFGIFDCPTDHLDPTIEGAVCLPGKMANDWDVDVDALGRRFTGHWVVEPGREVNRTRVTTLLALEDDTRVHFVSVHLHPFAESVELRDLTDDVTVFRSEATNHTDRVGLANVTTYSSAEGFPVYADHEYEMVSVYNNTSGVDQDSMAVLYLYMVDTEFTAEKRREMRLAAGR